MKYIGLKLDLFFLTKETVFRDMESRTVLFNSSVLNYLVCNVECYNANISLVQFSNEKFVIVTCFKKSVLQLKQSLNIYMCAILESSTCYIYIYFFLFHRPCASVELFHSYRVDTIRI